MTGQIEYSYEGAGRFQIYLPSVYIDIVYVVLPGHELKINILAHLLEMDEVKKYRLFKVDKFNGNGYFLNINESLECT